MVILPAKGCRKTFLLLVPEENFEAIFPIISSAFAILQLPGPIQLIMDPFYGSTSPEFKRTTQYKIELVRPDK